MKDVATIFYGFEDPVDVVSEYVGELFRGASVGAPTEPDAPERSMSSTAGMDGDLLHIEMGVIGDDAEQPLEVRCFTYELDEIRMEANLNDINPGVCPGLALTA